MRYLIWIMLLASCDRVFNLTTIEVPDAPNMGDVAPPAPDTMLADAPVDAASSADAVDMAMVDHDCDPVAQTGCEVAANACYPTAGCVPPGTGVDGAACVDDTDCQRGYFCGAQQCYRICDCDAVPGAICNDPVVCAASAGHVCKQYVAGYGYCIP